VKSGDTRPNDRVDLIELSDVAAAASLCGLGRMAANPVLTGLRSFSLSELAVSPSASTE
jgi:NADH:ubiquinone oxidoreductase subunit F (NADH-binding)